MKDMVSKFWKWYERHYLLNLLIAGGLFVLQLVHLFWLAGDVIATKLTGQSLFHFTGIWKYIIIAVDYTEIPALITTSIVYLNEVRKKKSVKSILFLFFINSQWLHLFWITDEFVVDAFTGNGTFLPLWLAWIAILIDYLEVPVIIDVLRKLYSALRKKDLGQVQKILQEK